MAEVSISRQLISSLLALPARQIWTDYDSATDTLYVSFRKPQQADDSILEEDGNIYHYHGRELVGVTILHASAQAAA